MNIAISRIKKNPSNSAGWLAVGCVVLRERHPMNKRRCWCLSLGLLSSLTCCSADCLKEWEGRVVDKWRDGGWAGSDCKSTELASALYPSNSSICTPFPFPLPITYRFTHSHHTHLHSHKHTHTHVHTHTHTHTHTEDFSHLSHLRFCLCHTHTHTHTHTQTQTHTHRFLLLKLVTY